eukprot:6330215-Pyramimonas_sp.AAC.1
MDPREGAGADRRRYDLRAGADHHLEDPRGGERADGRGGARADLRGEDLRIGADRRGDDLRGDD